MVACYNEVVETIRTITRELPPRVRAAGVKSLFLRGTLPAATPVAIVGSRRPTPYGRQVVGELAAKLGAAGVPIVSGLAFGVDCLAHEAALEAGGACLAVLPGGLDDASISPQSNRRIAERIIAGGGGVISEYPVGTEAYKSNYAARNRIITAFAEQVVVIEAGIPSGTLITARHAADQSRDLWAVPGPITSPISAGTNRLITEGARPLTDINGFLEEIGVGKRAAHSKHPLLELLLTGERATDELADETGRPPAEVERELTTLELRGLVRRTGPGRVVRT